MKLLLLSICLLGILSCGNQQKKSTATHESNSTQQEVAQEIPYIFHGITKSISIGQLGEDGEIVGVSEHKQYAVKYALYLDNGLIAIFDDNTQLHKIIMYIGNEECDDSTRYLFATYDQDEKQGYVEFDYYKDGTTLMMVDYSDYIIGYILETFMPQTEFEERVNKCKK